MAGIFQKGPDAGPAGAEIRNTPKIRVELGVGSFFSTENLQYI